MKSSQNNYKETPQIPSTAVATNEFERNTVAVSSSATDAEPMPNRIPKVETGAENIAFPTTLERDIERPGAVPIGPSSPTALGDIPVQSELGPPTPAVPPPSQSLGADDEDSTPNMVVVKGQLLQTSSSPSNIFPCSKRRMQTLIVLLVLVVGVTAGLAVGLRNNGRNSRQSSSALNEPDSTSNSTDSPTSKPPSSAPSTEAPWLNTRVPVGLETQPPANYQTELPSSTTSITHIPVATVAPTIQTPSTGPIAASSPTGPPIFSSESTGAPIPMSPTASTSPITRPTPMISPTRRPTPTPSPILRPTPTSGPTRRPTPLPTFAPTQWPTSSPSVNPTSRPTPPPTSAPTRRSTPAPIGCNADERTFEIDGECHRLGSQKQITVAYFAMWGSRRVEGELCLEEAPTTTISCGVDEQKGRIRRVATFNANCLQENDNAIECTSPSNENSYPMVIFTCQHSRVEKGPILSNVELSHEMILDTDTCSESFRDFSFLVTGPLCRSAQSPENPDTPLTQNACETGEETAVAIDGRELHFCVDHHDVDQDDIIDLHAIGNHPEEEVGVLEHCLTPVIRQPPLDQTARTLNNARQTLFAMEDG